MLRIALLFETWRDRHANKPVTASALHPDVRSIIDPPNRGLRFIVAKSIKLENTRISSLMLTRCKPPGKSGTTTYAVSQVLPLADPPVPTGAEG